MLAGPSSGSSSKLMPTIDLCVKETNLRDVTRTVPALRDQVAAALAAARQAGWDGLLADQRRYLDDFWARADVELSGDSELQQAVRFALFHVLQAGARA